MAVNILFSEFLNLHVNHFLSILGHKVLDLNCGNIAFTNFVSTQSSFPFISCSAKFNESFEINVTVRRSKWTLHGFSIDFVDSFLLLTSGTF